MYQNRLANLTVVRATVLAVVISILTHYEGLIGLSKMLEAKVGHQRVKVLYAILSLLSLHVVEIWIFGFGVGGAAVARVRCAFCRRTESLQRGVFSAVTYSTVGYGD